MTEAPRHDDVRHEPRDVPLGPVAWFLGALLAAAAVITLGLWGLFRALETRQERRDPATPPLAAERAGLSTAQRAALFPEPRLQTGSVANARELFAREKRLLTSYGWVDRRAGLVRIPIERAMDLMLEGGVASGPQAAPSPSPVPTPGAPPPGQTRREEPQ
jgi:hypothetical protein